MTIVILGAGDAGAALARDVAAADTAARVILVDDQAAVARGKALDIAQAAPIDGYTTALAGTDDTSVVVGADAIAIADRVGGGEWQGDPGLALVRTVSTLNERAPILGIGTEQASLLERSVAELGLSRRRVFGSAPEALRGAVTAMVGLESPAAPDDISLTVLGRPPSAIVVPWDQAAIAGRGALDVLSPPSLVRLEQRLPRLWPPGPLTLGAAAARVVQAMATRSPRTRCVFAVLGRDEGGTGRAVMVPARLHGAGIASIERPALSARDRVRFESAAG